MRRMGLQAIYPKRRATWPAAWQRIYPYLLRNLAISRPDQVWATDITYVPMRRGFVYLVAIMHWYSRYVLAWRLSNTLQGTFCLEALGDALSRRQPEIFGQRPGQPVHGHGVHRAAGGVRCGDQHGRPRPGEKTTCSSSGSGGA